MGERTGADAGCVVTRVGCDGARVAVTLDPSTVSQDEFQVWERAERAETEAVIAAFESAGDVASAERARMTLALIDRAVVVASGRNANN